MGAKMRDIIGDSQLRWLGPEQGVMHMAIGAVINPALGHHGQTGWASAMAATLQDDAGGFQGYTTSPRLARRLPTHTRDDG